MWCADIFMGCETFSMQWKIPKNGSVSKWHFENKTQCHYRLIKIILFFHGKSGFSWGIPLRAKMAHVIITLVGFLDVYIMSKIGHAQHTFSNLKKRKSVPLGYAVIVNQTDTVYFCSFAEKYGKYCSVSNHFKQKIRLQKYILQNIWLVMVSLYLFLMWDIYFILRRHFWIMTNYNIC